MGKTLETKRRILELLSKKEMTISGLSRELGLTTATVSQHIVELQETGAIEKVNSEYFKKLKYYRIRGERSPVAERYIKYVVGAVVAIGVLALLFALSGKGMQNHAMANGNQPKVTSNVPTPATNAIVHVAVSTPPNSSSGFVSCPMMFYTISGNITSSAGMAKYGLNYFNGTIMDYVLPDNSEGTLYLTEMISNVLPQPAGSPVLDRQHYASIVPILQQTNPQVESGISVQFHPPGYTVQNGSTIATELTLSANASAKGTYWLRIDGPCGGGVRPVLLTIGNAPYSGTPQLPEGIYG
jgi:DNA-binding transcriptional ArsR family regulator